MCPRAPQGHSRRAEEVAAWLRERPSLAEVRRAYPAEWDAVRRDVARLVEGGDPEKIREHLAAAQARPTPTRDRERPQQVVVSQSVRRYLMVQALNQAYVAASSGVHEGTLRFGLVNGWTIQRLLFRTGLERKPAPWLRFRLLWPLLRQRRRLMPLVRPQGIYCFYSDRFVAALARLIGDRACLEIAAGDGTLARFLHERGIDIVATDDHSWAHYVQYPDDVVRQDARTSLRVHAPRVVLCSWPPPGNDFERHVFRTPSVELYVVIGSEYEPAAGDWVAYRNQREFEMTQDTSLGRLLLPPENRNAVYVFRRRTTSTR